MPTNRTALERERRPAFSPEALALFVVLEQTPKGSRKFKDGARELARMLDLTDEFWTGNHVSDRSRAPCHPDGYLAYHDWFRCRRVRDALLAACGLHEKRPTKVS
jgi:hypothetical protein